MSAVDEGQRRADGVRGIIALGARAALVEVVPHAPPTSEMLVGRLDPLARSRPGGLLLCGANTNGTWASHTLGYRTESRSQCFDKRLDSFVENVCSA